MQLAPVNVTTDIISLINPLAIILSGELCLSITCNPMVANILVLGRYGAKYGMFDTMKYILCLVDKSESAIMIYMYLLRVDMIFQYSNGL